MRIVRIITVLFVFGVLLLFGLVALLAEPMDVNYNVGEFIAIKAIAIGIVIVAYKCLVATFQVIKEGRV